MADGDGLNPTELRTAPIDKDNANIFQGLDLSEAAPADIPKLLRTALKEKLARVIDCFRQLDDDASGVIDGPEFAKGLGEMGLSTPPEALGALFASFDADGSGLVTYAELHTLIAKSAKSHPKLPPLPLTAKNPIALRKGEVSAKDGSLLQGIDLSAADPSAVPGLVREIMGSKLLRVIDVFRQLDDDDSGFIDGPEFAKGLKEMGCAAPPAAVGALFASLDPDGSGLIEYDELHEVLVRSVQESPELPPLELEAKNPIALRTAPLAKKDANLFQGAVDLANAAPEALPGLIRDALNAKLTRVIDLFRQLDDDASGTIDAREFAKGLREMGLNAPKEAIGAIFDSFNEDGGAFIEYDELHEMIIRSAQNFPELPPLPLEAKNPIALRKKKIKKEDANLLQSLDIDEDHLDLLPGQLKAALQRESVRVLDLFRQFDDDASGSISRAEFRKALGELGLKIPALGYRSAAERTKAVCLDLFKVFNTDGGKTIEYDELQGLLRKSDDFVSFEQYDQLEEREDARLRPATSMPSGSFPQVAAEERPRTTDGKLGAKIAEPPEQPALPPSREAAGLPPIHIPHFVEPLQFAPVVVGPKMGGYLFLSDPTGVHRTSTKLAVILHPLPGKKGAGGGGAGGSKGALAAATAYARVCALPLHRKLADAGYSILFVEPHGLGAPAGAATDEAGGKLRATLAFIGAHKALRYCKLALLAQGPAASACLAAMASEPALFDYRVKALSACQVARLGPTSRAGRFGPPLVTCASSCGIPTLVSYAAGGGAAAELAKTVAANIEGASTPCASLEVSGVELFGKAQRFDGAKVLGAEATEVMGQGGKGCWPQLKEFLDAHMSPPPKPAPVPEEEEPVATGAGEEAPAAA